MSDYARLKAKLTYSKNSDYSDPKVDTLFSYLTLTPDEYVHREITVGTTAYSYVLTNFNTITAICLVNLDATNYVEADCHYLRGTQGAAATLGYDLAADDSPETILDNDSAGTFVTGGAETGGYVWLANCEESANDGAHLISVATSNTLTLDAHPSFTLGTDNTADTTCTMTFTRKNKHRAVANNGVILITDPIYTAGSLILQANTAACNCELIIFGT